MTGKTRIGFATTDWAVRAETGPDGAPGLGGAGHYRVGLPAAYLAGLDDFEVYVGTLLADQQGVRGMGVRTWLDGDAWDLDIIVLQRWMFASIERDTVMARANGQVVVNDVDDWFGGLSKSNQAYWSTHPEKNPTENREHYAKVIAASTAITCSTPFLAKQFESHAIVQVLENAIDLGDFPVRTPRPGKPVIGWAGAVPWRSNDLEVLSGCIDPFLRKHGLTFHHSGHIPDGRPLSDLAKIDPSRVETSGMVPITEICSLYDEIDVGLVPLSNVPFNHAKSWIKGLEYAAAGLPFLASASPEYLRLHEEFGLGEVVRKRADWYRLLIPYLDPEFRIETGAANRKIIESQFDFAKRGHQWAEFYRALL